jgi:hypothetical protein
MPTLTRALLPARALLLALLYATPLPALAGDEGWNEAAKKNGVTIYNRSRDGSDVKEVRATGVINAPNWVLKNVVDDVGRYKDFMPHTKESLVLRREGDSLITYQQIDAPVVSNRDYTLRQRDESRRLPNGRIAYKKSWSLANHLGPPPKDGVVRVQVNEGYWLLEDIDGKKTKGTYYLHTNPGGSLPGFIINAANTKAIPDLFAAIEKAAGDPRYQKAPPRLPSDVEVAPPAKIEAAKNEGPSSARQHHQGSLEGMHQGR